MSKMRWGGCTFPVNRTISYDAKALFAPEIFAFNIFISNLEEDTGRRLTRCVQNTKVGRLAETGEGHLELQDPKGLRVSLPRVPFLCARQKRQCP